MQRFDVNSDAALRQAWGTLCEGRFRTQQYPSVEFVIGPNVSTEGYIKLVNDMSFTNREYGRADRVLNPRPLPAAQGRRIIIKSVKQLDKTMKKEGTFIVGIPYDVDIVEKELILKKATLALMVVEMI